MDGAGSGDAVGSSILFVEAIVCDGDGGWEAEMFESAVAEFILGSHIWRHKALSGSLLEANPVRT